MFVIAYCAYGSFVRVGAGEQLSHFLGNAGLYRQVRPPLRHHSPIPPRPNTRARAVPPMPPATSVSSHTGGGGTGLGMLPSDPAPPPPLPSSPTAHSTPPAAASHRSQTGRAGSDPTREGDRGEWRE